MPELIAYFSRAGENYANGKIITLSTGNTAAAAAFVQELTDGEPYQIEPVQKYSGNYSECLEETRADLCRQARPALKNPLPDMQRYDTVYLGYPNYWGTMPMPVFTFLESFDTAGKVICPFCTHEGSGLGRSMEDIKKLCPGATVKTGLALHGADVLLSKNAILSWLKGE